MSFFGSGASDYNRELKSQRDAILRNELTTGAIGQSFEGFQSLYAPMLGQMSQAAAVGANMDTQSMQANLARQGLGGTGLGTALGAGLRSGATFQTNQLRARLAQDAMQSAVGLRGARAGTMMQQAVGMRPDAGAGRSALDYGLNAAGVALQGASLFGLGDDETPVRE